MKQRVLFLAEAGFALLLPQFLFRPGLDVAPVVVFLASFVAAVAVSAFFYQAEEGASVRFAAVSRRLGTASLVLGGVVGLSIVLSVLGVAVDLSIVQSPWYSPDPLSLFLAQLMLLAIFMAVASIILGLIQWRSIRCGGVERSVLFLITVAVVAILALAKPHPHSGMKTSCANYLHVMGLVFKMFSNEMDNKFYPQLSSRPGFLVPMNLGEGYVDPLTPEYFSDHRILFCPDSDAKRLYEVFEAGREQELFNNSTYLYFGYAIRNEAELEAFAKVYRARVAEGVSFNNDFMTSAGVLYRLREGIEKLLAPEPAEYEKVLAEIPVLIEREPIHKGKLHVLYLDGHVKAIKYPGEWPATERTFEIIHSLESLRANSR